MINKSGFLFLSVIILLSAQPVFSISNVQHFVDGNKVTLTYQGTPPYWINIRGDTNIGQAGGYLWAKTYSNSFSYDMSFAINPSKKFYYSVKDSSWSKTNSFILGITQNKNTKDLSKYSVKEVFLVSDENWRQVLALTPLAVWTNADNTVNRYPLLVYHNEEKKQTIEISKELLGITTGYDDIEIEFEGPFLSEGSTKNFLMIISNKGDTKPNFVIQASNRQWISLDSNELDVVDIGSSYLIRSLGGYTLQLEAGEMQQYKVDITLGNMPGGGFDADSLLHFLEKYSTKKISYFGNLPIELKSLLQNNYTIEQKQNLLDYWKDYNEIIYVEDNYELAILASTYASLINSPLIIKGYNDNINFAGKKIICVGNPASICNKKYNLEQLQKKYLKLTNTNKIILVNPDLSISKIDWKKTEKGGEITELFGKTSLLSAYLASVKKELILPVNTNNADNVNNLLKNDISELNIKADYLTILASPLEIQNTKEFIYDNNKVFWSIDNTLYGNIDNDPEGFSELKTGRIYGFSISDVSTYIARMIFINELLSGQGYLFIGQGVNNDEDMSIFSDLFSKQGYPSEYRTYSNPTKPADYKNKRMIYAGAHGSWGGSVFRSREIPYLENTIILESSCSTCAFDYLPTGNYGGLFCLEELRKGASGIMSSVDSAGYAWDSTRINTILTEDLGTLQKKRQNLDHARSKWYTEDLAKKGKFSDSPTAKGDIQYLLGDPTVKINFDKTILPPINYEINYENDKINIILNLPSITVPRADYNRLVAEGVDDHLTDPKYSKFFLKIGPITLFENYDVESDDVNPMFFGGIKIVAIQEESGKDYAYFLIEKDLSLNQLNQVTNNKISIRIIRK